MTTKDKILALIFCSAYLAAAWFTSPARGADDRTLHAAKIQIANGDYATSLTSATTADRQFIFPDSDGSNGYVLSTNGSGTLSWVTNGSPLAIGSAITSGTPGSILFVGAGPVVAQNNAQLFWDATNARLGLGTITPAYPLDVRGSTPAIPLISGNQTDASGRGIVIDSAGQAGYFSGGTGFDAVTIKSLSNALFLDFAGSTSNNAITIADNNSGNLILRKAQVSGVNTVFTFPSTTGTAGSPLLTDGAGVTSWSPDIHNVSGNVGIGTATPSAKLHVKGSTSDNTASALKAVNSSDTQLLNLNNDGHMTIGAANFLAAYISSDVQYTGGYQAAFKNSGASAGSNGLWVETTDTDATTTAFNVTSGGTPKFVVTGAGNVGIGTATPTSKLHVKDGHVKISQTTAPTAAAGAANPSGTCILVNASDAAGRISVHTDSTGPNAAGVICDVTFNAAYGVAPICTLTAASINAAAGAQTYGVYVTTTTTALSLNFAAIDPTSTTYLFNYSCVETQ